MKKSENQKNCLKHIRAGVKIIDLSTTYIEKEVVIGKNVIIYPNNYICGSSEIRDNTIIYPNCLIMDSVIGENCEIGPFSNIKQKSKIGNNSIIGAYVEVKNSLLKDNVKAKHHAYLGDVDIDDGCNIGCGVIFANYDGKNKHRSTIYKNVFIGSNVTIVSPIVIKENAFIAAGSTIVENVDANSLAIARNRQINKLKYYK